MKLNEQVIFHSRNDSYIFSVTKRGTFAIFSKPPKKVLVRDMEELIRDLQEAKEIMIPGETNG